MSVVVLPSGKIIVLPSRSALLIIHAAFEPGVHPANKPCSFLNEALEGTCLSAASFKHFLRWAFRFEEY